MACILHLETATEVCSVALSIDGELHGIREEEYPQVHSTLLTVFVEEVLKNAGIGIRDLSATAVSIGPGSYTGLRIGLSTAKGICFAAGIPLISVSTLESFAHVGYETVKRKDCLYAPLLDARRMEVYSGFYKYSGEAVREPSADIIDSDSYRSLLSENRICFFGSGMEKTRSFLENPNSDFRQIKPSARGMIIPAERAYLDRQFSDLAYTEPFYLKEFYTTAVRRDPS